ncbi:MAG TPA: alcohol dehydrogenase catalytic domain-containing protein [Trebonia sp.]|nr:alcohol dehydrogenase catalytic domain-containing protein [Trebonia sp.]
MSGMRPGTILGHETVGVVEEVGPGVRNFNVGDRVVIPSTIACGNASPNGKDAGTAFYGGPATAGSFDGLPELG